MKQVIKKPIITEKFVQGHEEGLYAFEVEKSATKPEIKHEVQKMYNVTVEGINTMVAKGKLKMRYTKAGFIEGRTAAKKKAVVKLKEGDFIDFYSEI